MNKILFLALAALAVSCVPSDGVHTLHLLTTNDVHGKWFDTEYSGKATQNSLMAVNYYVDSIRKADGAQNVLLLDAGDCLQGDNATYYYNYVDTVSEHLFPRLVSYMKYDGITVGNHDVEAGHRVYDRVRKDLRRHGIPFFGGNAIRNDNGKPYFDVYKVYKKAGLKVLVLGYTNANNPAWMDEILWSGMHFESLIPLVQKDVDRYTAKTRPDVVIVTVHSATGDGDGKQLEAQGSDLYRSLRGVDFLVCSHDHREMTFGNGSIALINTGNRAKYLGHGTLSITYRRGREVGRKVSSELIPVDKKKTDPAMKELFKPEFEAVKAFSNEEIGALAVDLKTRDAYIGMCPYIDFLHTVMLRGTGADVSFAAPLTFNGIIRSGVVKHDDLFKIYPFENGLYCIRMSGKEIKDYLEFSYDHWLASPGGEHALRIVKGDDPRNDQKGWSFVYRPYNFDSAAGINYTVDINQAKGKRISISSMADGRLFDMLADYKVAVTSYRASGAGGLLTRGAGIREEELQGRILNRYPEIREFIYDFFKEYGLVDEGSIYDASRNGRWCFIPEEDASRRIEADLDLMF